MKSIITLLLIATYSFSCTGGCIDMASTIFAQSVGQEHTSYVEKIASKIEDINEQQKDINKQKKAIYEDERNKLNELNKISASKMNILLQQIKNKNKLQEKRLEILSVKVKN